MDPKITLFLRLGLVWEEKRKWVKKNKVARRKTIALMRFRNPISSVPFLKNIELNGEDWLIYFFFVSDAECRCLRFLSFSKRVVKIVFFRRGRESCRSFPIGISCESFQRGNSFFSCSLPGWLRELAMTERICVSADWSFVCGRSAESISFEPFEDDGFLVMVCPDVE